MRCEECGTSLALIEEAHPLGCNVFCCPACGHRNYFPNGKPHQPFPEEEGPDVRNQDGTPWDANW